MIDSLKIKHANNLIDLSSIKYVVVPMEDIANDDDFFKLFGENRNYYINSLDGIKYLKKINIGTKEIVVYENEKYRPHIYITDNKESILRDNSYQNVDYKFEKPSEYKITLYNISKPVFLTFTDSYHPAWKLRVGDFNWFSVLTNKEYFISDINHYQNDVAFNSFYINPQVICSIYSCLKNNNGSYNIKITLYFKPQSYLYLGSIISFFTFIIVCIYFVHFLFKKKNHENI